MGRKQESAECSEVTPVKVHRLRFLGLIPYSPRCSHPLLKGELFLGAFFHLPELYPCICVVSDTGDYSIVLWSCHSIHIDVHWKSTQCAQ